MTIVKYELDGQEKTFSMDNKLHDRLITKIKPGIHQKDKDRVIVIDGAERSGKSVFAQQLGYVLDPTLSIDRICFTPEEFQRAVTNASKGQCVIYDEAFTGLSSRSSLAEVNRLMVSLMMEMGQRNLFVIIVIPTFFLLDRYVALFRSKDLFHIYTKEGKRGRWIYFNSRKKKVLYILGKKMYDYSKPKSKFRGRFYDRYTVNEAEYRKKKRSALIGKLKVYNTHRYMVQRNALLYILHDELTIPAEQIAKSLRNLKIVMARRTISDCIQKFKNSLK